jgi:hypothetical protein
VNWEANWIWDGGEPSPRNAWRCFRRTFALDSETLDEARLAITADSRYVLWVNGTLVGRGPVRSWPSAQMYDEYEIGHLLRGDGQNAIAVLVHHYGLASFSYLRGRGGLLAQLGISADNEPVQAISTDSSWRVTPHSGYDPRAPRLSQQLGFTEQLDARRFDENWVMGGFDDSSWQAADCLGPVGTEPWTTVVPRDIPALAEEVMQPVRIESLSRVEPVSWITTIDVRNQLVPGAADHANHAVHAGYVATIVRTPRAARAVLGFPSGTAAVFGPCSINGVRYELDQFHGTLPERYLDIDLQARENWLVFEVTALDHGNGFHVGLDTEVPFELVSPIAAGPGNSPFISIGPFPANPVWPSDATWKDGRMEVALRGDLERYQLAGTVASSQDLDQLADLVRPIPRSLVSETNVFGACVWVHSREEQPVPFELQQLAAPNGTPVDIPQFSEGDTEFVVDFGRIQSGYLEFEVEAPAGTILDFYGFEFLHDGQRQDTYRVDNTLRYTCRDGSQHFVSAVRRGMRYLMVTVRGKPGRVRFHDLRFHQSNYPAPEIGSFRCSDALLNDIWEISRHTTRVCMEDTFVDCPTYEQAFWVGDSRNESLVAYYAFGAEPLVRRCLNLVPGSREQTPFYGSQVPSGWTNVIPNWTFLWVLACREHFHRTGDMTFVRDILPHIRFTLDTYLEQRNTDGLLSISAWNLLDWAPIDQPNDGVVTHQNCFLVAALRAAADLADLAEDRAASAYRAAASELTESINRHLWSDEENAYIDAIQPDGRRSTIFSVPTQVVAFLGGLATGDRAEQVAHHLLEPRPDFVPIGSPFMSFFHYEALVKLGKVEAMLDDMRVNYGAMLAYGATTCWEMYPNYTVLRANPTFLTRSHCHAWSAGPLYFLSSQVLGVRPAAPGWTKVIVEPAPAGLAWANGSVPLPDGGTIDVTWSIEPDRKTMQLRVSAPWHVEVEARLPGGYEGSVDIVSVGKSASVSER